MCFILVKLISKYNMLSLVIQISVISIVFIFLVHHLLTFFKSTLTVPKIKDLVNSPNQKYQNIYDTIAHKTSYTNIDLLPTNTNIDINTNINTDINSEISTVSMKNELKSFLKKQMNKDTNDNILGIDTMGSSNYMNI